LGFQQEFAIVRIANFMSTQDMRHWNSIVWLALSAASLSANAVAAAPALCDLQLTVELTPDVPDPSDAGFLSSLLGNHPGYRLTILLKRSGSVLDLELTGPGRDYLCHDVIDAIRKDGLCNPFTPARSYRPEWWPDSGVSATVRTEGGTMKILAACVILLTCSATQAASKCVPAPAPTCDRECLRSTVTAYLYALLKHDTSKLPVSDKLRVTEDAIEKPFAKVSLMTSVTRLRGFRQDILDERTGMAGADVIVEESGAPTMLVVRLKVVDQKITEIETVATHSRAEGLIFNIDGLSAPSEVMNYAPRAEQLPSRDEAIKAAMHYPAGLNAAKTFAAVNAPFAPNAYRYENGQIMAGPDCKFAPGCQNISTQSLEIFNRLGKVATRVIGVDERMGIVWLRMAWGVRQSGGDQLTVWETFKVYDGQIHAVEAFMKVLPLELANGGWD
jgi:hypothetical protein